MSESDETQFLKKISESKIGHDEYDLGKQLKLSTAQTDAVIKRLLDKGLVEDDPSKIMIQDNTPRLRIKLTESGRQKVKDSS